MKPPISQIDPVDEHVAGELLVRRLNHWERKLKNGGKQNFAYLSSGVSAMLASQMEIKKDIGLLATREEVRSMIKAHADTCGAARQSGELGSIESIHVGKDGINARGSSAVKATMLIVGIAAIFFAISAPHIDGWIRAWKGHPPIEAQK